MIVPAPLQGAMFVAAALAVMPGVGAMVTRAAADPVPPPVPSVNYPSRDPNTRPPDRVPPDRVPIVTEREPREAAPMAARGDGVIEYRYVAGAWGHWGHDRRFHAAPAAIARELEERRHAFPGSSGSVPMGGSGGGSGGGRMGGPVPQSVPRAEQSRDERTHAERPGGEETRRMNGLPNGQRGGIVSPVPMPREHRPPR